MNVMLSRSELINKLKVILSLYQKSERIREAILNFTPEDNYERKFEVPVFPGKYNNNEERKQWEKLITHEEKNAVETMKLAYERIYKPKEPQKPMIESRPAKETPLTDELKQKKGWQALLAVFIAICSLISGGLFSGEFLTVFINAIIIVTSGIVLFLFYSKLNKAKVADEKLSNDAIAEYEQKINKQNEIYQRKLEEYESSIERYESSKSTFINSYIVWRDKYLKHLREEREIQNQLESDKEIEANRIYQEKYIPAKIQLENANDLISDEYLPVLHIIINLLESNRADGLKEAINLYEEIAYRERQLKLQREAEEQRRYEEERRRQDEERRLQEEIKLRRQQERQQRYDEEKRKREEAERQAREDKEREERERKAAWDAKKEAERKCHWCTNWNKCGMKRNPPLNCTGFQPGNTHQI